ncbi:MAG: type IV pilus assembly protein PilM [Candidatus Omnitrophica bacterium]|nr:type IV pilus assembly protein PilM [Candidatus Omnitrophota bacterium]
MNKFLDTYFKTIKRFLPERSAETSVGIDIGTGECKLIELIKKQDSYEVVNWSIRPVDNNDIASALKAMLSKLGPGKRSIYTSVSGRGTLIRYIEMPHMSVEDMKNSFGLEADKYFPFAQNEIYSDCSIIDNENKKKLMYVMAAVAKKDIIDLRIKLLSDLGYKVDFIGLNPVALANVMNTLGAGEEAKSEKAVAVLDMGGTISNLSIFIKDKPWFTRDIFVGGRDFTKRISNILGVDMNQAEILKTSPSDQLEKMLDACDSAVTNIVQEIKLSFDYFSTERNFEVGKLLLTGGASKLEGLSARVEKHLEIPVVYWNPLSLVKMSSDISPEEIKKESMKLGVALGLALYNYD